MRKYIFSTLAIAWTMLITFLSLVSLEDGPKLPFSFADKIIHGIIYFMFAIIWYLALVKGKTNSFLSKNALLISVLFAIIYGICVEIMQDTLVSNRQGDWEDALANSLGAIVAALLIKYLGENFIKLKTKN